MSRNPIAVMTGVAFLVGLVALPAMGEEETKPK